MIHSLATKFQRKIALGLLLIFYCNMLLAHFESKNSKQKIVTYKSDFYKGKFKNTSLFSGKFSSDIKAEGSINNFVKTLSGNKSAVSVELDNMEFSGGPTQPEMQAFQSVNNSNMVDLFTGDFSYNIPLLDVGGYPINIAYRSGISMDQEASWVGLGWNINPGTISRNMRGLPDDFNGADSITKTSSIKENKTVGLTIGGGAELVGLPLKGSVGASLGIFHNNYKGWGLETGLNASLNSGSKSNGALSAGLSITNNSQEGLSLSPSLSVTINQNEAQANSGIAGSLGISSSYNSRTGLKGLQLQTGLRQFGTDIKNQSVSIGSDYSSSISFATPSYTPTITLPYTSSQYSFTGKLGGLKKVLTNSMFLSGYVTKQGIADEDRVQVIPAYGYLNYQNGTRNGGALLDYNREKEIPYREKPAVAHIAVPSYTYDLFSITGEGTGGMFRAYRGDIGFVYDHFAKTKDASFRGSVDLAAIDLVHGGVDLNINRSYTQSGPWTTDNPIKNNISFRKSDELYEAVYFRNPGEKAINSKSFYDSIGGDDVVAVDLYQSSINSSTISAANFLKRYNNKKLVGKLPVTSTSTLKKERDKRSQVISYLTAREASEAGLSKYIESYKYNSFTCKNCDTVLVTEGIGIGLEAEYFNNTSLSGNSIKKIDNQIDFRWLENASPTAGINTANYSVRWTGRIKAPATGTYILKTETDDGVRLWLNDSLLIDDWNNHDMTPNQKSVSLIENEFYNFKMEYYNGVREGDAHLYWLRPGQQAYSIINKDYLYPKSSDLVTAIDSEIVKERRINSFRKKDHISEITVLNTDGRRYIYGLPVYNLFQKEATFSVNASDGNSNAGLVGYNPVSDASTLNQKGKDTYFNSEVVPAYAHSFLLSGIVSSDYVDITGNGISDDDLGDGIKFNYTKLAGKSNPFKWRAPHFQNKATYNEGLKSDTRDDKGNYVYGEKELWYWHSIESKSMVATFTLETREDLWAYNEHGVRDTQHLAKRLKEINLYSKADFIKNGQNATPIKTVHFEYTYDLCKGASNEYDASTGKLTLKKIWFTYNKNNKGKLNPYIFNYHSNNPEYNIKSYDRWGNYKDPLQNPGSNQNNFISNAEYSYSLKDSAVAAVNAAAWTLTDIKLPSGGRLKVDYESDDYAFVQNRRAMEMFRVFGFASSPNLQNASQNLFDKTGDNLYVFIRVTSAVSNASEVYAKYLEGIKKIYFKLSVKMPTDKHGSGNEYIPCYADLEASNSYGVAGSNIIWLKLKGISKQGDKDGSYSPLAKAAIQFLRLNLPSKAYRGSEVGDEIDFKDAVMIAVSQIDNVKNAFKSYDETARNAPIENFIKHIDSSRTFVRLNSPEYKKYGGGIRVKRVVTYDNWNTMSGQKEATYGQEYDYSIVKEIGGKQKRISSGVASYEPTIGSEENPFHQPIEFVEKISPLGPVTLGYTEEPLGESFFPSPGVGYSKVRIRSIHTKNKRSANGYEESEFYTAYDFPTFTDWSMLQDNKKRYKPSISNFLRINAKHFIALSQGFKVELNDMHGKLKTQATYPETDPDHPVTHTKHFYKVENQTGDNKKLSNHVTVINPKGEIDTSGIIGKDVELMMDMRQQVSISNGNNFNVNGDLFSFFIPPVFFIPSFIGLAQREENQFRSVATTKIIQRYGILDSVIHIDKGSRISTKNLLYDSETGEVLLTRTHNEFKDPMYNFSYPTHWAYEGMGMAYQNIDATLNHLSIKNGKIQAGISAGKDTLLFTSGDELLVSSKPQAGGTDCNMVPATFPNYSKLWVVDANVINGGAKQLYFIDKEGHPFSGNDVSLKIVRSGRRNISGQLGVVSSVMNPILKVGSNYELQLNTSSKVINASATEFKQLRKVEDRKKFGNLVYCYSTPYDDCSSVIISRIAKQAPKTFQNNDNFRSNSSSSYQAGDTCVCNCLKPFFNYLVSSHNLFIQSSANKTVGSILQDANNAGYNIPINCQLFNDNQSKLFYALTTDSISTIYKAKLGDCIISWSSGSSEPVSFYQLQSKNCVAQGEVDYFMLSDNGGNGDTITLNIPTDYSMINYRTVNTLQESKDTISDRILSEYKLQATGIPKRDASTVLRFKGISQIPGNAQVLSAALQLTAVSHIPGVFNNPHSITGSWPSIRIGNLHNYNWNYNTSFDDFSSIQYPINNIAKTSVSQNFSVDVQSFVNSWVINNYDTGNILLGEQGTSLKNVQDSMLYSTFFSERYEWPNSRPFIQVKYLQPMADTLNATLRIEECTTCETIATDVCYSAITDTLVNPYASGILGNYKPSKSYTYFTTRTEVNPTQNTNIRTDGTFKNFGPFWNFQSKKLTLLADTTKWIWNSESTLFNSKGFEIENKDPLGRHNAGLYGYNLTLPTAVAQNGRYREIAFDGFEDYDFASGKCDTICSSTRHIDFSTYKDKRDTTQAHSGRYSLRLNPGEQAGISAIVDPGDDTEAGLSFTMGSNNCGNPNVLKRIRATSNNLLPTFSPLAGKDAIISAWVKEEKDCKCQQYSGNRISIAIFRSANPDTSYTFYPSGSIIEGWQRYENVIKIPSDAHTILVNLEATDSSTVYFDDLRLHPFNANMKSFVYHPVNLRLMAELDENNYATYYEYDDDGTLIRVKKETQRGVKTIKETRTALIKE